MKLDSNTTSPKMRNYGPWQKKFIWWDIINNKNILFRYVWRRHCLNTTNVEWDYALTDFDLLTKSSNNYQPFNTCIYYF